MPIYIASQGFLEGFDTIPYLWPILKTLPWLALLYFSKSYFQGSSNGSERNMHGKVVLVTVREVERISQTSG